MRKVLLSLLMTFLVVTGGLKAQSIAFTDGFESGSFETENWTQEAIVGNTAWQIESAGPDLMYPSTVIYGTKRAYLRNTTGETQGFVTRLITPVMKLDTVYQPFLSFWYANPKWTADRDTLRVLYKTGEKANWKELVVLSDAKNDWEKVSITLPEITATYQIAFEGKDNLGRGIVLDSVLVRSTPECTVPHDLVVANFGSGKVNLAWTASWDATRFEIVISADKIDPDTLSRIPAENIAFHGFTETGLQQNIDLTLKSGEYFYAYVRSICETENSSWNSEESGDYRFRVKAMKYTPYTYGFDMDYNPGYISRDPEWTWGTNADIYTPHINTNLNKTELAKYSNNATQALCFCGLYSSSTPQNLPAATYAYAATPTLMDSTVENFSIKDYQVRFWTTAYTWVGRAYAHSVIVGVMTDPSDVTTFVPVDTVSVWGCKTFQENIVDLGSYNGEGTYVAFLSNFDVPNRFFVDNMVIEKRPAVNKVTKISVNPRDTFAIITWEGNAPSYQVLITKAEVNPASPLAADVIDQATVTTNSFRTDKLEADHSWNQPYYVYVKAGEADWSYRYPFVTIAGIPEFPFKMNMEESSAFYTVDGVKYPKLLGVFGNDADMAHLTTTSPYKGNSCLYLSKDYGNDSWITFPMLDSIQDKQLTFYLSGNTTPDQVHATVGIMTNPMDINTFVPVSDVEYADGYIRCYANFANYQGEDGVIAIVWGDTKDGKNTNNYIDNVSIETIATCLPPTDLTAVPADKTVNISWAKSTNTEWEWILSKAPISEVEWDNLPAVLKKSSVIRHDTLQWADPQAVPGLVIDSLEQTTNYYFYIRTLCGPDDQSWWIGTSFRTECSVEYDLPYTFTFEGQASGSTVRPLCWTGEYSFSRPSATSTTIYPYVNNSYAHSGSNSLYMYSYFYRNSTTQEVTSNYGSMIVAPKLADPLNEVLVEFWMYGTSLSYELYVGTVSSPTDSDFVALDTIKVAKTSQWLKYTVDFTKYTGTQEYIAFRTYNGKATNSVYLDDIKFKTARCAAPFDIKADNVEQTEIDVVWRGMTDEKWEVKVLNKRARLNTDKNTIAPYDTASVAIVNDTILTDRVLHVDGLTPISKYYVYVRALCGDSIWALDSVKTGCKRIDPMKANKETFESYPSGTSYDASYMADCWTVGINSATAAASNNPYIYKSTTYAASGENVLRINESSSYAPAWAASPEIQCNNMKNLFVSFAFYASSSYWGVFGVMSDPEDLNTFTVLDSLKGTASLVRVSMDLRDYADSIPDNARYFAWRGRYNAADLFYIDDVSIIEQTCPVTKPSYSDITSEQVRVSSGLRTDANWELLLVNKEVLADSLESETFVLADSIIVYHDTLDTRSKTVTGLEEKTKYYGFTRSLCTDGNSPWMAFTFSTPCLALTPEAMGVITFEEKDGFVAGSGATRALPCWTIGNKYGNTTAARTPYILATNATYKHNDHPSLEFYDVAATQGAYAIMPQLKVDDISKYQVNFWGIAWSSGAHKLIVGIVTDPADLNTFVAIDTVTFLVAPNWTFNTVLFESYEGDYLGNKGKYIMFLTDFGGANDVNITEISVEAIPSCKPVKEIVTDSIGEDFAILGFESEAPQARLLISDKEVVDSLKASYDKWLVDTIVTKYDSIRIDNLKPNTGYYAYAQIICAVGDSSRISLGYTRFITDCPSETGFKAPYFTDFDSNSKTGSGNRPDCWTGEYLNHDTAAVTQSYPYVNSSTTYSYSGTNSLYFYSYGTQSGSTNYRSIAVAPKMQGNLNDYMISFYGRQSSTGAMYGKKMIIGYVTNTELKQIDSTFVKLGEVEISGTTHQYCEFRLEDKPAIPAGARIALKADYKEQGLTPSSATTSMYAYFYIDNFRIGLPPTCYPPTIEDGKKTTLTSATVNITPAREGNNKWELAVLTDSLYKKITDIKDYLDTVTNTYIADTVVYEIKGLKQGTAYQVFARTVCGGDDGESEWTNAPLLLITKYYYKDSYTFGFEKTEDWVRSPLAPADTYFMHPALVADYDTLSGSTKATSYSYYPYGIENTTSYVYGYGPKDGSKGKGAMRLYAGRSSSADYYGDYVVFPEIAEPKARSFEFKVRPGYLSYSTMKSSTSYPSQVQVGTIDKGGDITSLEILATIDLPKLGSDLAEEKNNFLFTNITLDFDSATIADKQVVIYQPKAVKEATYAQNFIDDVKLGETKGYSVVSIKSVAAVDTAATIKWTNIGGPWNLYVTTYNEDTERTDTVAKYLGLTGVTEQVVADLQPQTKYTAILVAADAPAKTDYVVSSTKTFTTPCKPLEANAAGAFFWDFNDPTEWEASDLICANYGVTNAHDTAFHKPGCFTTGWEYYTAPTTSTVNYGWMIIRKGVNYISTTETGSNYSSSYAHYEYGRDDSPALKVYTTSSYNTKPYFVLPELKCDYDTMMIEFWGRCFANYDATHGTASNRNKIAYNTYLGASYCKSVIVGTVDDPNDFSTFQAIDTLSYQQTSLASTALVTSDATGYRYWEKMQTPLSGAKGKYIAIYQPAYGLFFIDDLSIKPVGDNIFAPYGPATGKLTQTTATFSWKVKHPTLQSVVVVLNADDEDKEVLRDTIVGTEYTATGLKPATVYKWYMYQINGEIKSNETERLKFTTDCEPITPDYTTSFESGEEGYWLVPGATAETYKQNKCWIYGNAGTTTSWTSSFPYNYLNTTTSGYSHDGDYAIKLYAYSTTLQTYAAMPAMEDISAYDTLQVNFWMRPGYQYPYNYTGTTSGAAPNVISTQYTLGSTASTAEYYYSKAVIVGTMTDPNDPTTFVPIDTVNYIGTFAKGDAANASNDYLFQKKKVSLRGATGPYVAFMSTLFAKGETRKSTYDHMWIDDVSFSRVQECQEPTDLNATDIEAYSATLNWTAPEGATKYVLQVSSDYTFAVDTAFVFNDTITVTSMKVENLKPYTEYTWRIKTICTTELGESEFSQNNSFVTARVPYYGDSFAETTAGSDWSYGTTPAVLVIDSTDVEITGANSTSYGFKRITNNYGIQGPHFCTPFYSSSTVSSTDYDYYWMISPTIYLSDTLTAHLTMDMALTQSSTSSPNANPVTEANMADDFLFLIVVSDDGGKTWKKENIVGIWNNTLPAGNQLRDIPTDAVNMRIDLSKFAGKNVRIAFYREAETYLSTTCALHLGNFRIANFAEVKRDTTACQYQDFKINGFEIDGDKINAGEQTFKRRKYAKEADALIGMKDTIFTLDVDVLEAPITLFEDTICYGESYSNHDFSGKTKSGIYRRKLQAVDGCDSIAELHLFVRPELVTNLEASICQGDTLKFTDKFIGQVLNRQGVYFDTISASTGCDSVLILSLSVLQPATSEFSAKACETTGYYWEAVAKTFTQSGDYTEKLQTVEGCDSTVTLHLTINKPFEDATEATIEKGDSYSFYGETFTESGTYEVVVPGQGGDCDSTHVLTLTVNTALDNVENGKLMLLPNIIRAGESVTAKGSFSGNIHVEVYDIVGRMILNEDRKATHNRIEISAFDNAGVYTVRISDKLNTQFVGRVIVQ